MVKCLECNKELNSLSAHLRTHGIKLEEYKKKYADPETGEPPNVGWTVQSIKKGKPKKRESKKSGIETPLGLKFSTEEEAYYKDRYETLFVQADEDPALAPTIKDIILGETTIARYQTQVDKISKKVYNGAATPQELELLDSLEKKIKETQKTNLSLLDSLSLTRKSKKASKQVVDSTPSRMISALNQMLRSWTPEIHARLEKEIEESQKWMIRNLQEIKASIVVDANTE